MLEAMLAALPDHPEAFLDLCGGVSDWDTLLERACLHGVSGVLCHALAQVEFRLPPAVGAYAKRQRAFEQVNQAALHAVMDEVLTALQAAEVSAVALKGPVLGERLYGHPFIRISTDLDFLLEPADLTRATATLAALGYRTDTGPRALYFRRRHHHIHLHREHPWSPTVELHFRAHSGFVMDAGPLLARALPYRTVRGASTRVLSPEDELLYLTVHAAGHFFRRLLWLYDLKLLLRDCPGLDWGVVLSRARSFGIVRVLAFTLELLRRLNVDVPGHGDLVRGAGLGGRAATSLLLATGLDPGPRGELAFLALLSDRPFRFLGRRIAESVKPLA